MDRAGAFLKERLIEVGQSGVRVRPLGGDRAGEVRLGRFLRRERVTPGKMIEAAGRHTSERVADRRARPNGKRTLIQRVPWPIPHGSVDAWADGTYITDNRDRL